MFAYKRNQVLMRDATRVGLEDILLRERRQHERPHIVSFHSCGMSPVGNATVTGSRPVVAQGWGGAGIRGSVAREYFFFS